MNKYDLAFIVPLEEEFRVLAKLCRIVSTKTYDAILYNALELRSSNYRAVAVLLGEKGPTYASQVAEKVFNRIKPKGVVLLGVAGALSDSLKIGDIIVASEINQFQAASKAVRRGKSFVFHYSGDHWKTSFAFTNLVQNLKFSEKILYDKWQNRVKNYRKRLKLRPEQLSLTRECPEVKVGHIASGDTVSACEAYAIELKGIDRDFLAIEMEAAGVAQAAYRRGRPIETMIIRGISDFADERKKKLDLAGDGTWRKYAMYNATTFLLNILKSKSFHNVIAARDLEGGELVRKPFDQESIAGMHEEAEWHSDFGRMKVEAFAWYRITSQGEYLEVDTLREGGIPRTPSKAIWNDSKRLWSWIKENCNEPVRSREIEEKIPQLYDISLTRAKTRRQILYPGPAYRLHHVEVVDRPVRGPFRTTRLGLTFRATNWFVYAALNLNLDERVFSDSYRIYSMREREGEFSKIKDINYLSLSSLSNLFSIAAILVTRDQKTILTFRSGANAASSNLWQASIAECMIPIDEENGKPDPRKTVVRGFEEELGVSIKPSAVRFLALAIDRPVLAPFLCARVDTPHINEEDLREFPKVKAKGFWEHGGELKLVNFDLASLTNELRTKEFSSPGQMCIIYSLVNEFGYDRVIEALGHPKYG